MSHLRHLQTMNQSTAAQLLLKEEAPALKALKAVKAAHRVPKAVKAAALPHK